MNLLIVTVGSRDIQVLPRISSSSLQPKPELAPGKDLQVLKSAREGGLVLFNNASFDEYLEYPIIKPAIEHILRHHKDQYIDLIMVSTDQSGAIGVGIEGLVNDTLHLAKVIERLAKRDFSFLRSINHIIVRNNVVDYDVQFNSLGEEIERLNQGHIKYDNVFIQAQGGIDAINTALLCRVILSFKNTAIHHLNKPWGQNISVSSDFPSLLKDNIQRDIFKSSLEKYNFYALNSLPSNSFAYNLALSAHHRLNFNLELSVKHLEYASTKNIKFRNLLSQNAHELRTAIDNSNNIVWLKEWYLPMRIMATQGNFSSLLIRAFSLAENTAQFYIMNHYNLRFTTRLRRYSDLINDFIDSKPELKQFLNEYRFSNGRRDDIPLHRRRNENGREVFDTSAVFNLAILNKINSESVIDMINSLEPLRQMRNNTAHNFGSIDRKSIDDTLRASGTNLDDLLNKMDVFFDVKVKYGVYSVFKEILEEVI